MKKFLSVFLALAMIACVVEDLQVAQNQEKMMRLCLIHQ